MTLRRNDLHEAITDPGLLGIITTEEPAPLTREGLDELFFICAAIDDPKQTEGVQVEINYDASGNATSGNFFIHSFGILNAAGLGGEFFPLIDKAWNGPFTNAAYSEFPEEGDPYDVLPFGIDYEDPGSANAIIVQVMESAGLQEALRASLERSKFPGEGPRMLSDYCQAVLGNLRAAGPT